MRYARQTDRNIKLRSISLGLLIAVSTILLVSCGTPDTKTTGQRVGVDPMAQRADEVFSSVGGTDSEYPGNMITAGQLNAKLQDPAEAAKLSLLDTRPATEIETQGSIPGTLRIKMQEAVNTESLGQLPKDKIIVCISPTGHTANQVATMLRWLGYDAVLLEYGMGSWTRTPAGADVTAGDAQRSVDFPFPVTDASGASLEGDAVAATAELTGPNEAIYNQLQAAAKTYMNKNSFDQEYPFNHIFAQKLFDRLADPALKADTYLLDIRTPATFDSLGHIEGAVNIPWRELGQPGNLEKLPRDKLIVVIGANGRDAGQVTPILTMLGYETVTLRSGMAGWSPTPETQEIIDAAATANYPVVTN